MSEPPTLDTLPPVTGGWVNKRDQAKHREYKKRVRYQRRAEGLCAKCGVRSPFRYLCAACAEYQTAMNKISVTRRRQMGLCARCGQPSDNYRCPACRAKARKQDAARRTAMG